MEVIKHTIFSTIHEMAASQTIDCKGVRYVWSSATGLCFGSNILNSRIIQISCIFKLENIIMKILRHFEVTVDFTIIQDDSIS